MLKSILVFLVSLNLLSNCAPFGLKQPNSMSGKDAAAFIQADLGFFLLFVGGLTPTTRDRFEVAATDYNRNLILILPNLLKIDDEALYSEKDVQECSDNIFFNGLFIGFDLAVYTCNLKPLPAFGVAEAGDNE
ncbi:MAG: TIGR04452 family lipoprotein [Leptospiraceae bacterium]|nr:TIGR04452 family lipoprotein [Leptospiraceae bacterium]